MVWGGGGVDTKKGTTWQQIVVGASTIATALGSDNPTASQHFGWVWHAIFAPDNLARLANRSGGLLWNGFQFLLLAAVELEASSC